jgi:hypothetical protein
MLENLVVAVESESQIVDLGRVSGFMQKVCSLRTSLYLPDLYFRSEMASSDRVL